MSDALAFVGDVHLDHGDAEVDEFVAFLDSLAERCGRLILLGDLFNLWLGRRELEQPHQTRVIRKLETLRARGMVVRYVEGNRDYRIARAYSGSALDDSTDEGLEETFGGHRIYAVHGDLTNPADRQYRRWRRISRSWPLWVMFNAIPRAARLRLAERLERRMRATNLAFKQRFPEKEVEAYGASLVARGFDVVVLGHFHVQRELLASAGDQRGRILVLPEWKGSRRHLEVSAGGGIDYVDWR